MSKLFDKIPTIAEARSAHKAIKDHLLYHEEDIAIGINDFGELRLFFRLEIGREPKYIPDDKSNGPKFTAKDTNAYCPNC